MQKYEVEHIKKGYDNLTIEIFKFNVTTSPKTKTEQLLIVDNEQYDT